MKYLFTLIIFAFTLEGHAQMTIQYGGSVGFDMNYRALKNHDDPWLVNDAIIDSRNDVEAFCARPAIGFDTKFNFTEKIGLKTGILYDVKGYMLKGDFTIGAGTSFETVKIVSRGYDHFVCIPAYFTYTLPIANAGLEFNAGLLSSFYIQTNNIGKTTYGNGDVSESKSSHSDYSRFMEQGVFGCNYLFNPGKIQYSLGLDFKYAFTSIAGATNIREYYYSIGLNFGLLFGGN